MQMIDINGVVNTLLAGLVVVFGVAWLFIHLCAVRDLRQGSPRRLH